MEKFIAGIEIDRSDYEQIEALMRKAVEKHVEGDLSLIHSVDQSIWWHGCVLIPVTIQ